MLPRERQHLAGLCGVRHSRGYRVCTVLCSSCRENRGDGVRAYRLSAFVVSALWVPSSGLGYIQSIAKGRKGPRLQRAHRRARQASMQK